MKSEKDKFGDEKVLVVPDNVIREVLGYGQDFYPSSQKTIPGQILENAFYVERKRAEIDESIRQLIPYVIIKHGDSEKTELLLFKRLKSQSETRLHDLFSLGAGGHINPVDDETGNPVTSGLRRELEEELFLPTDYELIFKGWIYSNIDPVSRVHAGMVFVMNLKAKEIKIREDDKMTAEWHARSDLKNKYDQMEGWSKILMDNLFENE